MCYFFLCACGFEDGLDFEGKRAVDCGSVIALGARAVSKMVSTCGLDHLLDGEVKGATPPGNRADTWVEE